MTGWNRMWAGFWFGLGAAMGVVAALVLILTLSKYLPEEFRNNLRSVKAPVSEQRVETSK